MKAVLFIGNKDSEGSASVEASAKAGERQFLPATTEEEALVSLAARRDDIDVAIIDLTAGQPALDVLRTITQAETPSPIIVLTGNESPGALNVARSCGAAAFVHQPFTREKLAPIIALVCAPPWEEKECVDSDVWGHPHRRMICASE